MSIFAPRIYRNRRLVIDGTNLTKFHATPMFLHELMASPKFNFSSSFVPSFSAKPMLF